MPLLTTLTCGSDKAQISMAEVGELTQYGYAERLMRTIKEEEVDLFAEGTIPAAFKVSQSQISPTGVIVANLERAGEVQMGTVGE